MLVTTGHGYYGRFDCRFASTLRAKGEIIVKRVWMLLIVCLVQVGSLFAAEPKPMDPTASTPPVKYQSAFEGYRSYKEEPIADWRALNAEVGAVGGHMGIMGGAAGHGAGATKPAATKPVATEGSQSPVRGAPKAPGGGAHSQH